MILRAGAPVKYISSYSTTVPLKTLQDQEELHAELGLKTVYENCIFNF